LHREDDKTMSGIDRTALLRALPYARRYARALTGSQPRGDALVADALREMLAAADGRDMADGEYRTGLYGAISAIMRARGEADDAPQDIAMPLTRRMLLLLTALEEQPLSAAATAVGVSMEEAEEAVLAGRESLRSGAAARVLIIEDEPIIALDIQDLVERCGHSVVGIAATEAEAVEIARAENPGLVLADINLGAGGDGATAVARILQHVTAPVIFVTAFPERLLTGEAVEPAFVITKPFDPTTLAVATYQAVSRGVRPL
jgi:CheY-like chemotaxis protein